MELNITRFFTGCTPRKYSASRAELGEFAGQITWNNAVADSPDYILLDTENKREAFRAFVESSGGWTADEIAAWSDTYLHALCLQWIAGDMRESMYLENSPIDWEAYESDENEIHRIFRGIDGEIYFYIGS